MTRSNIKIKMFIEDGQEKKISSKSKGIPATFAGIDAPIKAAQYLEQKYHITRTEIEKKVD